jgi:antitoxin HicB
MGAKKLEEYLKLPYTIEIIQDFNEENPGWVARVVELPGCFTESDTFEGLQAMLEDAMRLWIATALEDGLPIPEPRDLDSYSGKFIVRVPKSLHRQLAEQAQREDISLNQYVSTVLAKAVGATEARATTIPSPMGYQITNLGLTQEEEKSTSLVREDEDDYQSSPEQAGEN